MSKERLEEVKQIINYPNYTEHNGQEEIFFMVSDNDLNWLIEQAERVQELENHIDHLYDNNVHLKGDCRLQEQNKRYREAIEVAIHNIAASDNLMAASDNLGVKFALGILEQALEGRE